MRPPLLEAPFCGTIPQSFRVGLEEVILSFWPLAFGFVLSTLIAWGGYQKRSLSRSGVAGAVILGTLIFGLGGWIWGLLLIAFFVSSSLLSRYKEAEKEGLAEKFAKGHQRDLGQALANGGWGAVLAVLYFLRPDPLLFIAFVGAMATVNADTWGTEVGVLSSTMPRLVTNGKSVPVGTSGGVTSLGTLAALAGGLFIGLVAFILRLVDSLWQTGQWPWTDLWVLFFAGLGGLAGCFFDSLLGATVQGIYYCEGCQKETESQVHRCGRETCLRRGWRWLDNDMVNFISSAVGGVIAVLLGWLIL
jgi:uncharacterized protein (TIGR00297 family)